MYEYVWYIILTTRPPVCILYTRVGKRVHNNNKRTTNSLWAPVLTDFTNLMTVPPKTTGWARMSTHKLARSKHQLMIFHCSRLKLLYRLWTTNRETPNSRLCWAKLSWKLGCVGPWYNPKGWSNNRTNCEASILTVAGKPASQEARTNELPLQQ